MDTFPTATVSRTQPANLVLHTVPTELDCVKQVHTLAPMCGPLKKRLRQFISRGPAGRVTQNSIDSAGSHFEQVGWMEAFSDSWQIVC
jgi:hypothetical protein